MYPEIFQQPRDDYLCAFIRKIAEDEGKNLSAPVDEQPPAEVIDVYLGSVHVSPISRLWNTQSMQSVTMTEDPKRRNHEDESEDEG
jgi:hypothetical protein